MLFLKISTLNHLRTKNKKQPKNKKSSNQKIFIKFVFFFDLAIKVNDLFLNMRIGGPNKKTGFDWWLIKFKSIYLFTDKIVIN